jgi:hypothetical protein
MYVYYAHTRRARAWEEGGGGEDGAVQGCVLSCPSDVLATLGVAGGAGGDEAVVDEEADDEGAAEETWCFFASRGHSFSQAGELNKTKETKRSSSFVKNIRAQLSVEHDRRGNKPSWIPR